MRASLRDIKRKLQNGSWIIGGVMRSTELIPFTATVLRKNPPYKSLSNQEHMAMILDWFARAQKASGDGGIPAKYRPYDFSESALYPSYPETSGYILSSLLTYEEYFNAKSGVDIRALVQFLLNTQLECGAFPGGHAKMKNHLKGSYFNSGQILLGLVSYLKRNSGDLEVESAISRCVNWMSNQIQAGGTVRDEATFRGYRNYYARATYGLISGALVLKNEGSLQKAKELNDRICDQQCEDGWIPTWGFEDDRAVLHTIAYTLRGLVESGLLLGESRHIAAVEKSLKSLLKVQVKWAGKTMPPSFYLRSWKMGNGEICPTGIAQLALVLFRLSEAQGNPEYRKLGNEMIEGLKPFHIRGQRDTWLNGTLPGSWPINGLYQPLDLVNWSIKFYFDGLMISEGLPPASLEG